MDKAKQKLGSPILGSPIDIGELCRGGSFLGGANEELQDPTDREEHYRDEPNIAEETIQIKTLIISKGSSQISEEPVTPQIRHKQEVVNVKVTASSGFALTEVTVRDKEAK